MAGRGGSPHEPLDPGSASDRSERKGRVILDAARHLFLRNGYLGTSMDEVAGPAKVSTPTVHKHFGDKGRLFVELLTGEMAGADAAVAELANALPDTQNLEADLRAFARVYLGSVLQPHLLRLRRLVIGEAERFPELAAARYVNGPGQAGRRFPEWFRLWNRRGLLHAEDPVLAGQHFNWLILSIPHDRALAYPDDEALPSLEELRRYADEAVRVFSAAYGPATPDPDPAPDLRPVTAGGTRTDKGAATPSRQTNAGGDLP